MSAAANTFVPSPPGSLRGNSLGTEGWCAVFAALRDNKDNKIESWDLQNESINVEIAKVLAESVSASTALKSLKCATACCPAPHCQQPLTLLSRPRLQPPEQQPGWPDGLCEGNRGPGRLQ